MRYITSIQPNIMYKAFIQTSNQNTIKIYCKSYFYLVYITVIALKSILLINKKAEIISITQKSSYQ